MLPFIERRGTIAQTPAVLAVMFGVGALVAIVVGAAPTWQNHGPKAGPGWATRAEEPVLYYGLTSMYCITALVSTLLTFFRFPRVTIGHIRVAFVILALLVLLAPWLILLFRT